MIARRPKTSDGLGFFPERFRPMPPIAPFSTALCLAGTHDRCNAKLNCDCRCHG